VPAPPPPQRLRVDDATITSFLDRLDACAGPPRGVDMRVSERYTYRPGRVEAELSQGEDGAYCCSVAPRNLSREGIGFLAGHFVYPGNTCRMTLPSLFGRREDIAGRVVRCRYLTGSGSLYEVGVEFDRPLDVPLFSEQARIVRTVLLDPDSTRHELLEHLCESVRARLIAVTSTDELVDCVISGSYELVLVDLDTNEYDAFALIQEIRGHGYLGPVVGLALQVTRRLEAACRDGGCTGILTRPVSREALLHVLDAVAIEPLVSSALDDPEMWPLIDRFVAGLRDTARELAIALDERETETVYQIARRLRGEAGSYGFEPITAEAEHVQALAALDATNDRLRPAVYELIDRLLAARPATGYDPDRP
jgi:CheY-like chemotaxis protein